MPIYEYLCNKCGRRVEKRQSVSDAPLKTCEECGGELAKQWSLSGFQFKGEGWYVTDYAGKKAVNGDSTPTTEKTSAAESTVKTEPASKEKTETATKPAADGNAMKT